MDLSAFESALEAKKLEKSCFVFAGKEDFLKERAIDKLIRAFVAPEDIQDNVRRFDGEFAKADDILGSLANFSFNDSSRISLLYRTESLGAAERKALCAKLADIPLPPDILLFFLTQETAVGAEMVRGLGEKGEKIDFWPPFENQIAAWVQKEARELGHSMTPAAAETLLEKVGSDLRVLYQELTKLCLQAGAGKQISPPMVEAGVGYLRQDTVFHLLDWVGMKNLPEALRTLESLLQTGEAPIMIFSMLTRMLRDFKLLHDLTFDRPDLVKPVFQALGDLLKLRAKSDFKANQEKKRLVALVQEQAKLWPPALMDSLRLDQAMQVKNLALALNFSHQELCRIWPKLLEMDLALKSTVPNQKLPLQKLLIELISGRESEETERLI